jgi:hypothetical protein
MANLQLRVICKSIQGEGFEQKVRISASSKKWRPQNNFEYLSNTGETLIYILQGCRHRANIWIAFIKILKRYIAQNANLSYFLSVSSFVSYHCLGLI